MKKRTTCRVCHGQGQIHRQAHNYKHPEICPRCLGSGYSDRFTFGERCVIALFFLMIITGLIWLMVALTPAKPPRFFRDNTIEYDDVTPTPTPKPSAQTIKSERLAKAAAVARFTANFLDAYSQITREKRPLETRLAIQESAGGNFTLITTPAGPTVTTQPPAIGAPRDWASQRWP